MARTVQIAPAVTVPRPPLADERRLAVLRDARLLDTPAEESFDRLTKLAISFFEVPVALVSLVDDRRQFFKSAIGLAKPWSEARETPLTHSFCRHVVESREPLIIEDAREHLLVRDNLAIPDIGVIAYAGIPLITADGLALGSFCVIDTKPRKWTAREIEILHTLAGATVAEIELRLAARRAEREHREKVAIMASSAEGIYAVDIDGRCTFANEAAAEMLGYTPAELFGRNMHELVHHTHPDGTPYSEADCPLFQAFRAGLRVRDVDEMMWRRDGTSFPVSCSSAPLRHDGEIRGAVVTFSDVTQQRRAQAAQRLLADTGRVLASSLDMDDVLDRAARVAIPALADLSIIDLVDGEGRVRRVVAAHGNPSFEPEFQGARNFPPDIDSDSPQAQVIRTGKSLLINDVDADWRRLASQGPDHEAMMRASGLQSAMLVPLTVGGRVIGMLTFGATGPRRQYDGSDLALAEEIARRAAVAIDHARLYREAKAATRARDDMIGIVSHDLRNPLHTITLSSDFLLEMAPEGEVPQTLRKQLEVIRRAAKTANKLIADLLDVTRIEAGRLVVKPRPITAVAVLAEVAEDFMPLAAEKEVELQIVYPPADLCAIADRDRLRQVFSNLVGNALKFTPSGGRITISAAQVGEGVRFAVADTGQGISPEQLARVFDRFWQASRTDGRGVGLGLSIAKGIVEAHGGQMSVSSEPGKGSTFEFTVPARRGAAAAQRSGVEMAAGVRREA